MATKIYFGNFRKTRATVHSDKDFSSNMTNLSGKLTSLITVLAIILMFGMLWKVEHRQPILPEKEKCLYCHKSVTDPDKAHPIVAFGCYACHLGNPYSTDKNAAHRGIVLNPGDLEIAYKTCGKPGCHVQEVKRVTRSLMATNSGIIGTLLSRWEKKNNSQIDVSYIKANGKGKFLSLDLYVKMCGGCHLWQKREPHEGWPQNRGGGCSACHTIGNFKRLARINVRYIHPKMSTVIPVENCLRCHNRSARIGLSYLGIYESPGYGTPFHGNSPSERRLTGHRFYLNLPPDIHWKKHRMLCIDCHTGKGLMGDGHRYVHYEEQVEITCSACHLPQFDKVNNDTLLKKLVDANGQITIMDKALIARGKKNSPLYNLQKIGNNTFFFLKRNGQKIKFKTLDTAKSYHSLRIHRRLKCQACHSSWIPQCYGCHYLYTKNQKQKDWIWGKKTDGRWKEFRYFVRFEDPTLGIDVDNSITTFSPCQVLVRERNDRSDQPIYAGVEHMVMSTFDPHTTSKESRSCTDCHRNPKTLGLGKGILTRQGEKWTFSPLLDTSTPMFLFKQPLDSFVKIDGTALQEGYRSGARPFSKKELEKILRVNLCLHCHRNYEDKIYRDFDKSYRQFQNNVAPCRNSEEKVSRDCKYLRLLRCYTPRGENLIKGNIGAGM